MKKDILPAENIILNASFSNKEEAIRGTGQVLVEKGYVSPEYIDKMIERENITSTFMGNFVAIPHGTEDAKEAVISSGITVIQVPDGVDFGDGNIAKVLIGIAGKGDEHLDILSQIAIVCSEEENVQKIIEANEPEDIISLFDEVN
ncbi:PTS sugar transporter subunit IIA [Evansella halocellulosilytica]|uniref:PTS sugar transporter subunit IIA n=1 Tax=Evansella halocellulosilytica TaxID=2011013 RepID=UPI000BB7A48C|nr:PTS sugar transporter subunit IIA [Evansella halocellulosilytica]